jgi:hypothetical protein
MSLVLVLDARAKSRQSMAGLVCEAGHRAIAAADAILSGDLVREHAAELWLIAANADDPNTGELQRWLDEAAIRPRPTVLLYDASGPSEPSSRWVWPARVAPRPAATPSPGHGRRSATSNASSRTPCGRSRPPRRSASS